MIKPFKIVLAFALVISTFACRNAKEEAEETKLAVEKIEAIEVGIEKIDQELEQKSQALEISLNELDSI